MSAKVLFSLAALLMSLVLSPQPQAADGKLQTFRDFNRGSYNRAINDFRRRANSGEIDGYLDLAAALKDLGYPDRACSILRAGLRRFKDEPRLLSFLGRIYYLEARTAEAIPVLKKRLGAGNDIGALIILGLCYQSEGSEEKAAEALEQAVSLDGNNIVARLSLADLYYRRNDLKRCAEQYKKISAIDASLLTMYRCWGDILMQTGNFREAFKVFEKISLSDPGNEYAAARYEEAREKLGTAFFEKEHEKKDSERKSKNITISPVRPRSTETVTVGLGSSQREVRFFCRGGFTAAPHNGGKRFAGRKGAIYCAGAGGDKVRIYSEDGNDDVSFPSAVFIRPGTPDTVITLFNVKAGSGTFWANTVDRSFRGEILLTTEGRSIRMDNILNLEEYLYGVVPSEMPADWPLEALKAQAVCARSEAMSKMGRHQAQGYDFCAEVHCQAYGGVEKESVRSNDAVDQTRGLVMVSAGKAVDAVYSSNCGGHTQNNVFGKGQGISYLKGKPDMDFRRSSRFPLSPYSLDEWLSSPPAGIFCDPGEEARKSSFRWVRVYSQDELRELLEKKSPYPLGIIQKIVVTRRMDSGHIASLRIVGTESEWNVEKELTIRSVFGGLRSSMFKVEARKNRNRIPEQFIFYGGGWGHGVGMCQTGAAGMAARDCDYREILRHYYADVEFRSLY